MEIAVILDNIRSLHNVGSIFRTADAAGVIKIHLCGITPIPVDRMGKPLPEIAKVALGAEMIVPWEKNLRTTDAIRKLKKEGYKIYAVEQAKGSTPYYKKKIKEGEKIALMMGPEVTGISNITLRKADEILEIPMQGMKESLNVSVAFGVVLFGLIYNRD